MDSGPDELIMAQLKAFGYIKDGQCFKRPYGWRVIGISPDDESVDYAVSYDGVTLQIIKGGKDNG